MPKRPEEIDRAEKAARLAAKKISAFLAKHPTELDAKGLAAAQRALNAYVRMVNRENRDRLKAAKAALASRKITLDTKGGA